MTTFTDADLKRLRFALENPAPSWLDKDNLKGLLYRLEAGERALGTLAAIHDPDKFPDQNCPTCDEILRWHKSKGE